MVAADDEDGEDGKAMPPCDPAPEQSADGAPAGPPVSDELLARLRKLSGSAPAWSNRCSSDCGSRADQDWGGELRVADRVVRQLRAVSSITALMLACCSGWRIITSSSAASSPASVSPNFSEAYRISRDPESAIWYRVAPVGCVVRIACRWKSVANRSPG